MDTSHYYAMIMAGGGGTRLWPMSRANTPKQLLALVEEHSMFRVSVERLAPIFPPERIYVVASEALAPALKAEVPHVPEENFIIEPYGKDNGPAAALGLTVIHQRDPEATVAFLPSDHHIAYREGFCKALQAAHTLAQLGHIVTLGISPSFPSTGFGYIQRGERLGEFEGIRAFQSAGFKEKPELERAVEFVQSGQYSWNSGMFIFKAEQALGEFARQRPELRALFTGLAPTVDTPAYQEEVLKVWDAVERISIDFAIMEHAENVAVLPVDIGWSDIGSWGALFDVVALDDAGNGIKGQSPKSINIDTTNTLVYADKLVVTVGVNELVVVDTEDALLICHRDRTQDVKKIVAELKANQLEKYL
jgi:mannose-1-phosphate guanylyltransferase